MQAHQLVGAWGPEHPPGASPAARAVTLAGPASLARSLARAPAAPPRRDGKGRRGPSQACGSLLDPAGGWDECTPGRGASSAHKAGDKEPGTAPSPKTKAPCPGVALPKKLQQNPRWPAWPIHLASRLRPAPTHSPAQAAAVANVPRQRSPSLDLGLSIDSCSCAVPACGHLGEGRKCVLAPPRPAP